MNLSSELLLQNSYNHIILRFKTWIGTCVKTFKSFLNCHATVCAIPFLMHETVTISVWQQIWNVCGGEN